MKFIWPMGFEIPDAWWIESGMLRFRPRALFYRCAGVTDPNEGALTLSAIDPPLRNAGILAFDEERLRCILRGFTGDEEMPPIEVYAAVNRQYRYRVHNGFHRFYASAAAGFPCIPVKVVERPFEFETETIQSTS